MAISKITITFNEDLIVDKYIKLKMLNPSIPLLPIYLLETFKTIRTTIKQVQILPITSIIGESSATAYASAFNLDYGSNGTGYQVSSNLNVVTIFAPNDVLLFEIFETNANVTAVIGSVSDDYNSFAPILTDINTKNNFFFAESPIHFNFYNENSDINIQKVNVEVYIWRGFQESDLPSTPSLVFNDVKKVSPIDNYIALEFHNEIKSYITSSNLNKNNPQWAYNTTDNSTTAGEGVYFHIVYRVDSESVKQLGTYFATIGYRYDFEQRGGLYPSYIDNGTVRKYANHIRYDKHSFNLLTTVSTSYSGVGVDGMIIKETVDPIVRETQTGVSCLIAYVNKLGYWDTFTPFGKFIETIETKRDNFSNSYRNPLNVDSQIQHLKSQGLAKSTRKFSINTGLLNELNNYQVQEIIQSPKTYLVIFSDVLYTTEDIGITVDNNIVTVDNTEITVDSVAITLSDIGYYSSFVQIPVINTNNNFIRKTKLNDKSSINYNLEFEQTNNYINDIL